MSVDLVAEKESENLPPGIYGTQMPYEGVVPYKDAKEFNPSVWDLIPGSFKVKRDVPAYAMAGGNIRGQTPRNTDSIDMSSTFGDEEAFVEVLLHEVLHNLHPRGNEELATRYATATTLHEWGKDLGSHRNYFVGMQSQYYH